MQSCKSGRALQAKLQERFRAKLGPNNRSSFFQFQVASNFVFDNATINHTKSDELQSIGI